MNNLCIVLWLITLYVPFSTAQAIYTWQDAEGVRHFSDSEQDTSATEVQLQSIEPTSSLTPNKQIDSSQTQSVEQLSPLTVHIHSPQHGQAIRSNSGQLTISAQLSRDLAKQEMLQLMVDNTAYGPETREPSWPLFNLDRGTHSFTIQVVRDGKLIALSQPITVHLLRATINSVKQ
ncbi:hypothetical protein TW81_04575 [Vibrio galatheae]|uniref:DUF4124 domain-containing protein n=1 Tax=Vibrio galatheae TaxID=579748 RepID=A0A0F4NPS1_9VIBR|nr:DUF4124 domain-containing protein [Vibrio galatheae]KJY84081.1 hypothetical protein TW81_04575 [Vibrio galatheae]